MNRTSAVVLALVLAACGDSNAPAPAVPAPAPPAAAPQPVADADAAHEARGEHKLGSLLASVRDECRESFNRPDPDEKAVLERLKSIDERPWADEAEWAKFQEIVARIRAREARMIADPRVLQAERKRNWVKENPIFRDVEITWTFADPYVIFQEIKRRDVRDTERVYDALGEWKEVPKDGTVNPVHLKQNLEWAKKGEALAKRDALLLTELHRRFRELFASEFKLPDLKEKGRMLTVLVMWNRSSFDKLLRKAGQSLRPSTRGFYDPWQQKVFAYLADDFDRTNDEIPCAEGCVQKDADQSLLYCGAQQLLHEYGAIYRGAPLKDNDPKVDPRRSMWFGVGFAEFMGASEVEQDKTATLEGTRWRHNRVRLDRVQESRSDRAGAEAWRIADFLKPNNYAELLVAGERLRPGNGGMASHFACRVWAFCHFLWNYDDGKYRRAFLDHMRDVLAGTQSSEKFATKIMKRPSVDDWGDVEMEFEWYWSRLLDRKSEKDKATKQWSIAATDAPTGKVEDDPAFVEAWRAERGKK